jgi:hypothetical protein
LRNLQTLNLSKDQDKSKKSFQIMTEGPSGRKKNTGREELEMKKHKN